MCFPDFNLRNINTRVVLFIERRMSTGVLFQKCKENYAIFLYEKRELLETDDVKESENGGIFV